MRRLKGIVQEFKHGMAKIELQSGKTFWTMPTSNMQKLSHVLVAWDWTLNEPGRVLTQADLDNQPTMRELAEAETEQGVSRSPAIEECGSGAIETAADPFFKGFVSGDEVETEDFSNPINGDPNGGDPM